jgi:hypothetical protein
MLKSCRFIYKISHVSMANHFMVWGSKLESTRRISVIDLSPMTSVSYFSFRHFRERQVILILERLKRDIEQFGTSDSEVEKKTLKEKLFQIYSYVQVFI